MEKQQQNKSSEYSNYFPKVWENITCEYCGKRQGDFPDLIFHRDHIVQRACNGSNDLENMAYACAPCNYRKGKSIGWQTLSGRKGKSLPVPIKKEEKANAQETDKWKNNAAMRLGL